MSIPMLTLGGVPIVPHSGTAALSLSKLRGSARARMSRGKLVQMTHWSGKAAGTISGQGFMPPGLDGLNYDGPLELLSVQQENITVPELSVALSSTPRPDCQPWAEALVGTKWHRTSCDFVDGVATATPVAGATLYSFFWLPAYWVFAEDPDKGADHTGASRPCSWSFSWEEA
ncbi:hypothetical protein [Pseudomonas sp. EA_35y_Pfl2_R111]|uniref:hypothetical protein n=1 Tax=Pseudomonas sp. EA_35y_Pfl2_R111 TaxID=3088689 RepID=UPI0030DC7D10